MMLYRSTVHFKPHCGFHSAGRHCGPLQFPLSSSPCLSPPPPPSLSPCGSPSPGPPSPCGPPGRGASRQTCCGSWPAGAQTAACSAGWRGRAEAPTGHPAGRGCEKGREGGREGRREIGILATLPPGTHGSQFLCRLARLNLSLSLPTFPPLSLPLLPSPSPYLAEEDGEHLEAQALGVDGEVVAPVVHPHGRTHQPPHRAEEGAALVSRAAREEQTVDEPQLLLGWEVSIQVEGGGNKQDDEHVFLHWCTHGITSPRLLLEPQVLLGIRTIYADAGKLSR